jgi:two-component system, OmpR family, KDP operon response regulator KdpE
MSDGGVRVLVVDDEPAIRRFLSTALEANAYTVFEVATGGEAIAAIGERRPDLVVLDLGLPDVDGIAVTRIVREWSRVPIIILSVREREADKVAALDAGADDYVTKPFGMGELLARMRVALRRSAPGLDSPVFATGELTVDLTRRLVTVAGRDVQLTPTEYDLLRVLVTNADRVLTHRHLLREVWGAGYDQEAHLLRVNMSNLRRKVEPDPARPRYIVTEPGVGYRLRTSNGH